MPFADGEDDTLIYGYGVSPEAEIVMENDELLGEFKGFSGAALYIRIEPQIAP